MLTQIKIILEHAHKIYIHPLPPRAESTSVAHLRCTSSADASRSPSRRTRGGGSRVGASAGGDGASGGESSADPGGGGRGHGPPPATGGDASPPMPLNGVVEPIVPPMM